MIHHGAHAFRRALTLATERPAAGAWTLVALVCALVGAAVSGLAAVTLDRWAERPAAGAAMIMYLREDVTRERAEALVRDLRSLSGVERAELVSPEDTARRLETALGGDTRLLDGVDLASLPTSIEATLAPGVRDVIAISPTVRALRASDGVEDVVVEDGGDDKIGGVLSVLRRIAWMAAAMFAGLAALLTLAAIRIRLDRASPELAVARLLGAGPAFLLTPSALAGMLIATLASIVAVALAWLVVHVEGPAVSSVLGSIVGSAPAFELATATVTDIALFVGAAGTLGAIAGTLAGASHGTRSR